MQMSWKHARRGAAVGWVSLVVGPCALANGNSVTATANVQGDVPDSHNQSSAGTPVATGAARDGFLGAGAVFTSSTASSRPGQLTAAGQVHGTSTGSPATDIQADADAYWGDSFLIVAAGHAKGEVGSLTTNVLVQVGLSPDFSGKAYTTAAFGVGADIWPNFGYNAGRVVVSDGAQQGGGYDIPSGRSGQQANSFMISITTPFQFGTDYAVNYTVSAEAWNRLFGGSTGVADAWVSLTWAGLTDVRDGAGSVLTQYSAVSATSGFDFRVSMVPEPGALSLFCAGLAVTGLARLRASRRR